MTAIEDIETKLASLGKSFSLAYDTTRKVWTWSSGRTGGSDSSLIEVLEAIRLGEPDPIPCVSCIDCGRADYLHKVRAFGDRFDPMDPLICPQSTCC